MKSKSIKLLLITLLYFPFAYSQALTTDSLFMYRSEDDFVETISRLKNILKKNGYDFIKVQNVDKGLRKNGYVTDNYKTVFFAKTKHMSKLINKYPETLTYLPLKITIYSEGDETILISLNPIHLSHTFIEKEMSKILNHWSIHLKHILSNASTSEY